MAKNFALVIVVFALAVSPLALAQTVQPPEGPMPSWDAKASPATQETRTSAGEYPQAEVPACSVPEEERPGRAEKAVEYGSLGAAITLPIARPNSPGAYNAGAMAAEVYRTNRDMKARREYERTARYGICVQGKVQTDRENTVRQEIHARANVEAESRRMQAAVALAQIGAATGRDVQVTTTGPDGRAVTMQVQVSPGLTVGPPLGIGSERR